jgi:hypothetical protein
MGTSLRRRKSVDVMQQDIDAAAAISLMESTTPKSIHDSDDEPSKSRKIKALPSEADDRTFLDYYKDIEPIQLKPEMLIEWWEYGIINDSAFIAIALKMDGNDENFDIENFCFRWRGTTDDKGKCKELKPNTVKKTIADLEKKGGLHVRYQQIQLNLVY